MFIIYSLYNVFIYKLYLQSVLNNDAIIFTLFAIKDVAFIVYFSNLG